MTGRVVRGVILLAGPASLVASVLLIVANRELFAHGPGVPTAGREEAWTLLWGCLALVLAAHAVSLPTSLAWSGWRLLHRQPLGWALRWAAAYHVGVMLLLTAWTFAGSG